MKKQDKKKFYLMLTLFGTLILGLVAFVSFMFVTGADEFNAYSILSILIAVIILAFASFIIIKRKKEIDQGIPEHDERSKKIMNLAAARAFYISLYWLLAIMWADIIFQKMQLDTNAVIGLAIMGMAIIWAICQIWYNKKGDKHI